MDLLPVFGGYYCQAIPKAPLAQARSIVKNTDSQGMDLAALVRCPGQRIGKVGDRCRIQGPTAFVGFLYICEITAISGRLALSCRCRFAVPEQVSDFFTTMVLQPFIHPPVPLLRKVKKLDNNL
jgi:hypothetical protein